MRDQVEKCNIKYERSSRKNVILNARYQVE